MKYRLIVTTYLKLISNKMAFKVIDCKEWDGHKIVFHKCCDCGTDFAKHVYEDWNEAIMKHTIGDDFYIVADRPYEEGDEISLDCKVPHKYYYDAKIQLELWKEEGGDDPQYEDKMALLDKHMAEYVEG